MARRRRSRRTRRTRRASGLSRLMRNPLGMSKGQKKMLLIGAAVLGGLYLLKKSKAATAAAATAVSGLGSYVTQSMVNSSGVSGLGYDVDSGASAFGLVGRADSSLYDDTF